MNNTKQRKFPFFFCQIEFEIVSKRKQFFSIDYVPLPQSQETMHSWVPKSKKNAQLNFFHCWKSEMK